MPVIPLSPGMSFKTTTHNGSIDVDGISTTECTVTATITGRASSMEKAEEIVEHTYLNFKQSENGLVLEIDKPDTLVNCSVGVSLDVKLPYETNLDLTSHNGAIKIKNISGNTKATTHNGKVSVSDISGITVLRTHNGKIEAKEISGDIDFVSYNGKVETAFLQNAEPDCDISMITHNGALELTTPANYSAKVNASTHNGNIETDLPITVLGKFNQKKLVGTIGDGQGEMKLTTYNGSIKIK